MSDKDKYIGARFMGTSPAMSPEFGCMEPGEIYPLPEERAKVSNGFEPIYGDGDKKKERKVK